MSDDDEDDSDGYGSDSFEASMDVVATPKARSPKKSAQKMATVAQANDSVPGSFAVGDRVQAICNDWKKQYGGEVLAVATNDSYGVPFEEYDIRFDDGEGVKRVKPAQIKGGVAAGDVVEAKCDGWKQFYRGEVLGVNDGGLSYHLKFEVRAGGRQHLSFRESTLCSARFSELGSQLWICNPSASPSETRAPNSPRQRPT